MYHHECRRYLLMWFPNNIEPTFLTEVKIFHFIFLSIMCNHMYKYALLLAQGMTTNADKIIKTFQILNCVYTEDYCVLFFFIKVCHIQQVTV